MVYYPNGDKSFRAIEIDPQLAVAWYNKGVALKVLGRTSEAKVAWANAKELGL
jgi:Flp pilus assembly protein TadD